MTHEQILNIIQGNVRARRSLLVNPELQVSPPPTYYLVYHGYWMAVLEDMSVTRSPHYLASEGKKFSIVSGEINDY